MKLKPYITLLSTLALIIGCQTEQESANLHSLAPTIEVVQPEPDQLLLPGPDDKQPWNVGSAKYSKTNRIRLDKILPKKHRIWGAAVATDSGRAILTYWHKSDADSKQTFAISCDLVEGKALARWPVEEFLAPYCIHPDGEQAIFCRKDGVRSQRETLYVANRKPGSNIYEMNVWRPLVNKENSDAPDLYVKEWEIIWAEFAGDNIVTLNNAGQMHVWNRHDLSRIAMIDNVKGMPTLTPDKSKVVFLTDDMVALLDPSEPKITSCHRVGQLPNEPVVTIQASGKMLAIGGEGQAILLRLDNLTQSTAMIDTLKTYAGMDLKTDFSWIGNFLCYGKNLYNFDSPIPVWRIESGGWHTVVDERIWTVIRDREDRSKLYFRSFKIPTKKISEHIARLYQSSEIVALRKGDPVQVNVTALPDEFRERVKNDLTQLLTRNGYPVADHAKVSLVASFDKPFEVDVTYNEWFSGKRKWTFTYEIQNARLEFAKGNDVLWSSKKYVIPPGSIAIENLPKTKHVERWGKPDLALFSESRLPTFLLGKGKLKTRGKTLLLAAGTKTYGPN